MKAIPQGKPVSGSYEVYKVEYENGCTAGYVTAYFDTRRIQYEFDSDRIYEHKELVELQMIGWICLTGHPDKPFSIGSEVTW